MITIYILLGSYSEIPADIFESFQKKVNNDISIIKSHNFLDEGNESLGDTNLTDESKFLHNCILRSDQ